MDISKAKFMCLGSNCYGMAPLMDMRIHGPVDNMLALHGLLSVPSLLNGEFEKDLFEGIPEKLPGKPWQNEFIFYYQNYAVVHNDAESPKYKEELKKRLDTFYEFYRNIHINDNNWFIYTLGQYDIKFTEGLGLGENTQELTPDFLNGYECLKKYNILDKTIFIGNVHSTPKNDFAKFHSAEVAKLGLHYIEITDICLPHPEKNHEDFLNIIKNI